MKPLLAITFLILLLSCRKDTPEPIFCWICEYHYDGASNYSKDKIICEKSEEEIRQFEIGTSHDIPEMGLTLTVTCIKKE
jgi:hypothetical protein